MFPIPWATSMPCIPDKHTIPGDGASEKEVESCLGGPDTQSDLGSNARCPNILSQCSEFHDVCVLTFILCEIWVISNISI